MLSPNLGVRQDIDPQVQLEDNTDRDDELVVGGERDAPHSKLVARETDQAGETPDIPDLDCWLVARLPGHQLLVTVWGPGQAGHRLLLRVDDVALTEKRVQQDDHTAGRIGHDTFRLVGDPV